VFINKTTGRRKYIMRTLTGFVLIMLLIASIPANAGESWTGTLVDTRCMAMNSMNSGNDHKGGAMKGCGSACAKMGIPVALLIDGKMHVLAAPAAKFADFIGQQATVSGMAAGDTILPKKVTVNGKEVNVGGMM